MAFATGYGAVTSESAAAATSLEVGGQQCRVIEVRGTQIIVEPEAMLEMWGFDGMVDPEPGDFILMAHADGRWDDALVAIPILRWFRFTASPADLRANAMLPLDRPISVAERTKLLGSLQPEREAGKDAPQLLRVAVHGRGDDGQLQQAVFISHVVSE